MLSNVIVRSDESVSRPDAGRPEGLALTPTLASFFADRQWSRPPFRGAWMHPSVVSSLPHQTITNSVRARSNNVSGNIPEAARLYAQYVATRKRSKR
jgi:hypothetical protein